MLLTLALRQAAELRARYGRRHCNDDACSICQTMALSREIGRLEEENSRLRRTRDSANPIIPEGHCQHCHSLLIDGMCARCSS